MSGVNPVGYQPQYPYPTSSPAPVTYTPYTQQTYGADQYRPGYNYNQPVQHQPNSGGGLFNSSSNEPYVTKQSVALGLSGAAIGWFCGGPIGAAIGGAIGLILGIIMNISKMSKAKKVAQQAQQRPVNSQQQDAEWMKRQQAYWQNSQYMQK